MGSACLFCGLRFTTAIYNRRRSGEHAYPQWLETYVPGNVIGAAGRAERGKLSPDERRFEGWYNQIVKDVCIGCNTGWMEQQVEVPVRPVLVPLLQGKRPQLTPDDQLVLARWAWKTGAMIHLMNPRRLRAVAPAEYGHFMQHRRPPSRSLVWIGQYASADHSGWFAWSGVSGTPEPPTDMRANVYIVNFTVGPVFFSVFGTSNPIYPPLNVPTILAPCVQRIWPPSPSFMWPPASPSPWRSSMTSELASGQTGQGSSETR